MKKMNLEKMQHTQYSASGEVFSVLCKVCGHSTKSTDVLVDTHGVYGDFYCLECVRMLDPNDMEL